MLQQQRGDRRVDQRGGEPGEERTRAEPSQIGTTLRSHAADTAQDYADRSEVGEPGERIGCQRVTAVADDALILALELYLRDELVGDKFGAE